MRLRTRVTAVAGLALTVGVVLGLVLLFLLQRHSARSNIDAQLRTYAVQIEEAGAGGTWPRPLPASPLVALQVSALQKQQLTQERRAIRLRRVS